MNQIITIFEIGHNGVNTKQLIPDSYAIPNIAVFAAQSGRD